MFDFEYHLKNLPDKPGVYDEEFFRRGYICWKS